MKYWIFLAIFVASLNACEKQRQASAEVGAVPKQIMDKATTELNDAQAKEAEQRKILENVDVPENVGK